MPIESEIFLAILLASFTIFGLALAYGSIVAPGKDKR